MGGFQGLLETCFFVKSFVWGTNALRDVYVWQICIQHMHGILNTQTLHILPQISERVYHICSWSFPWNSHWPKIQTFFVTFWHSFHMSSLISHHKVVVSKTFDGFVGSFTLEEDDSWLLIIFWMGGANYLSWERNFWFSKFFFPGKLRSSSSIHPWTYQNGYHKWNVASFWVSMLCWISVLNLIWSTWICCQYDKKR